MILLNFAHLLTPEQRLQIEVLTGQSVERIIECDSQVDVHQPLAPQVTNMVETVGLSPAEWQTLPFLVNPPALNFSAACILAEIHGRCGYFPPCLRLRPTEDSIPRRYEVAEILDLQAIRDQARHRRQR